MDKSKKYIKMCDCEEIQKLKPPRSAYNTNYKNGDIIALESKVFMYSGCDHSEGFIEPQIYNPKCIWLPRQDQLQEMVEEKNVIDLAWRFGRDVFCEHRHKGDDVIFDYDQFKSFEQLWLAFVMKEKYNKTWDGKKWNKK